MLQKNTLNIIDLCTFCTLPLQDYTTCPSCSKRCHLPCIYAENHRCITCKYCDNGECIIKLKRRFKKFANIKNTTQEFNYYTSLSTGMLDVIPDNQEDLLTKTEHMLKTKFGNYETISVQRFNKNSINEIIAIYSDKFSVWNVFGVLFYMRRCKICFEGFHTKDEYISVCNECLMCHNCDLNLANNIYENNKSKATFCHMRNNELKIINKKIKNCNKNVIKFFESLLCENNDITNYRIFTYKSSKHNFEDVSLIYCVNCYESYVTKYELCPVCLKSYTQEDMLECEWCYKWVHYSCEENKEVIKISEKESDYEFIYKCNLCTEFEDAWLGKCKKHVEEKKSEIINDNANCLICVRKFNAIERKLICLIKLNGSNNTFVHNICALSNFEINKNKCVIIKESHKCNKCKKMGAHVKCIFCVKIYFHFDCAFDQGCDLFRSNFIFPICQKHFFKHLNQMNTLAKNINLLEFHYDELFSLLEYRIKDYVINKDLSFTKIYYFPELCTFGFDHKYFYINNQKMKQTEIENKLLEYDVKINIDGIFNEVRDLVNTNTKLQPLQQKHFNKCLDYKYQIKNYTLSFISHLLQTNKNLEIRKSNIHGKGVFATRFYYPNEVIISYEGQRITFEESDIREKKYIDANFYMFKTSEEVIDATIIGNIAKFINQSCDPNCYSTEAIWGSRRGILICAKRFITVDEELTYKYMMNGDKILCRCDALNCKKVLN